MKTNSLARTLSLAVLGSILASPLLAATGQASGVIHPVNAARARYESAGDIVPGISGFTVLGLLGVPAHEPSKNVWIYHHMTASDDSTNDKHGCTNLVLTFKDSRLVSLYLVNENVVQKIIAQAKAEPSALPAVLRLASN